MPKSDLMASVERISERIARKILRECKAFGTMGTWIKTLQDDNRMLKRRVEELEIRVKKLNTHGPTPPDPVKKKSGTGAGIAPQPPNGETKAATYITPAQMKKIRTDRGFSQLQFALLLGIKSSRYANWEKGHSIVPPEFEHKIREIRDLKGSELRTRMHNAGIFQPNGKPQASTTNAKVEPAAKSSTSIKATVNNTVQSGPSAAIQPKAEPQSSRKSPTNSRTISPKEIKSIRTDLGMTQYEIAAELKIKETRYKNWEQGRVKTPLVFIKKIRALSSQKTRQPATETKVAPATTASRKETVSTNISAKELQSLREQLGLTRQEMADALNIKKNRYSNWEYNIAHAAPQFVRKMRQMLEEKKKNDPSPMPERPVIADISAQQNAVPQSDFSDILNPNNVPSALSTSRLREIRVFLKLTLRQFAERLNIKESRYTNWEYGYGKASPDYVRQILDLLAKNISGNSVVTSETEVASVTSREPSVEPVLSSETIAKIRAELGLTQKQIATALGIKMSRYKNWERGVARPPAEFSRKIMELHSSSAKNKGTPFPTKNIRAQGKKAEAVK